MPAEDYFYRHIGEMTHLARETGLDRTDALFSGLGGFHEMSDAKPSASMAGKISNGVAKGKAFSNRMVRKGAKYGLVAGGGALGYTQYRKQQQRSNNALNSVAVTNGGQGFYRNGNF